MKKSIVYIFVLLVICIFISSCSKNHSAVKTDSSTTDLREEQNMHNACKLFVNGQELILPDTPILINAEEQYAELPLIAISEALGGKTKWINQNKVTIIFNDAKYVLNPTQNTLTKAGDSFNIIAIAPGANHGGKYRICGEEFFVDSDTLSWFMHLLDAEITIDYARSIVSIQSNTPEI